VSRDSVIEGDSQASQEQAPNEDIEEARRRWEGIHDDECYRDVHGVPSGGGGGDSRCLLYAGLAVAMSIAVVAVGVHLVMRLVF
jgi:hypothetical protein